MYKLQRDYITNPLKKGEKPIKEDLVYLYIELNLSTIEIADRYFIEKTKRSIERYLEFYRIKKPKELKNERRKRTNIKKYGVENVSHIEKVKEKRKETCMERYDGVAPSCSEEVKEKIKQTNMERYDGVAPACSDDVKEKMKQTMLERYDGEYTLCSKILKEKVKQTNMERYGGVVPTCSGEVKEKIKQTNKERYGGVAPICSGEVKEKIKQTNKERYGVEYASQKSISLESLEIINDKDKLIQCFDENETKSRQIIADKLGVSVSLIDKILQKYNLENIYVNTSSSFYEEEIVNKIREFYDGEILTNRRILKGKEVDIYIPEHNLAIEFNGDFWHSENSLENRGYIPITYHHNKSMVARDKGIFLLHIFEYEYNRDKDKYISYIKQLMGFNCHIFAESCIIKQVDIYEYGKFMEENSLREIYNSHIRYGLYHNDELVEVMGFKELYNGEYELIYSNKLGNCVINGVMKLLNYFIKNYQPKRILCYTNIHNSSLNIFKELKFKNIYNVEPNYVYINNNKIYDCGKEVWEWVNV